jgi:hypothetical protein
MENKYRYNVKKISVADPQWFKIGSGSSILGKCGSGSGSRVLMTKNCLIQIAIYLSLGIQKGRTGYRRSLKPSKETFKTCYLYFLLFLWVNFALRIRIQIQPTKNKADLCGPATEHCKKQYHSYDRSAHMKFVFTDIVT